MERITEHHPVSGPVVYGYLRLTPSQIRRRWPLSQMLELYCQQHELVLGGVFTDHASTTLMAPAFAGLIGVLALPGAYGVLLPTRTHLGSRALPRNAPISSTSSAGG